MIPLARDAENVQFAIKTDVGIAASGLERERMPIGMKREGEEVNKMSTQEAHMYLKRTRQRRRAVAKAELHAHC